ncbi:hypothetical protein EHM76_01660, partial [bacterium]
MSVSHQRFGELLEEGIKRVHVVQKKPIGYILDTFGYELRQDASKGRYALGHWYYKKRIPAAMEDVEKLAFLIVTNSDVDRDWLNRFLKCAGHPDPEKLCSRFFLPAVEVHPAPEPALTLPKAEPKPAETEPAVEAPPEAAPTPMKKKLQPPAGVWIGGVVVFSLISVLLYLNWGGRVLPAAQATATVTTAASTATAKPSSTPHPTREQLTPSPVIPEVAATLKTTETVPESGPTLTSTLPVTALQNPDGECPPVQEEAALMGADPESILQYLNAGGAAGPLQAALEGSVGRAAAITDAQVRTGNLLGEKTTETAVNVLTSTASRLYVFSCHAGQQYLIFVEELQGEAASAVDT